MIKFTSKGDFTKTQMFLNFIANLRIKSIMHEYGRIGVEELAANTPKDSSLTANSWYYEITRQRNGSYVLNYSNSNEVNGVVVAILIQYGHATKDGGYVSARDYINPALKGTFQRFADEIWREVVSA